MELSAPPECSNLSAPGAVVQKNNSAEATKLQSEQTELETLEGGVRSANGGIPDLDNAFHAIKWRIGFLPKIAAFNLAVVGFIDEHALPANRKDQIALDKVEPAVMAELQTAYVNMGHSPGTDGKLDARLFDGHPRITEARQAVSTKRSERRELETLRQRHVESANECQTAVQQLLSRVVACI